VRRERLLQQRRLDRLLLVAHDVTEPRHRGKQRRRRLGGRLGELGDEPAPRAREHQPAVGLVGARGDRGRDRVPARHLQLEQPGRLGAHLLQQLVGGRFARDDLGPPLGVQQHHAGVEELRQPIDHRPLGLRRAQRVHQVSLQRGEAPEHVLVAARERAVDEVDDLPERRLVRHREHREVVLLGDLHQRRRHALEPKPHAEPERAHPALLELRHERALRLDIAAQPHAGREHHPIRRQPARGRVDLHRMRAPHRPLARAHASTEQLEPERVLGDEISEMHSDAPSVFLDWAPAQTAQAPLEVRRLPAPPVHPHTRWHEHHCHTQAHQVRRQPQGPARGCGRAQ
jgi:hypothetical protein